MPRLLSSTELGKELGVTRWTIRNWRISRGLPGIKVGSYYYYTREQVDKWLEDNKVN